jgi:hypothetical protein
LISSWRKLLELYVLNTLSKPTHRTLMAIMWVLGGSNLWANIRQSCCHIVTFRKWDHLWNKAITLWHIGLEHLAVSNKQIKSSFQKIILTLASFRCKSQFLSMKFFMGVILSLGNLLLSMFCRLKKCLFDLMF